MFDFDLRLGSPCCLRQSCSHPPGTVEGEGEAQQVTSSVSLGWHHLWMECRARIPVPGYERPPGPPACPTLELVMKLPRC